MKRRVCFASFELSPFTGGGIGTWLRNTLDAYANSDCRFEVLYYGQTKIDQFIFSQRFPGVKLIAVDMDRPGVDILPPDGPSRSSGFDSISQWRSYVLAMVLMNMERESGAFDIIEFTDWGGPAFYSIQEKKAGAAFSKTVIAVRLHSTEGSLRMHEPRGWSFENLIIDDIERQALRDADVVVGHLQPIVEANRALYGFDHSWLQKAQVNVPPIVNKIEMDETTNIDVKDCAILFTSKIQSFKRPDLFIRASIEFAASEEGYNGIILLLAFDVDSALRTRVEHAIPSALKPRVKFVGLTDQQQREEIISRGIAIFPGIYESFCYAAYEASRAGGIVVLNSQNPAFGNGTPWQDGVNCVKFDGTAHDLTRVLRSLFGRAKKGEPHGLSPIDLKHAAKPYWETVSLPREYPMPGGNEAHCGVSVIIRNRNQGQALLQTVSSLLTEQAAPLQIVVADDGSDGPDTLHALQVLENASPQSVTIVRRNIPGGYAAALNSVIDRAQHEIVCILSPGDRIEHGFLCRAQRAFSRNEELAALVPASRIVEHAGDAKAFSHIMPVGEPLATGLFVNRVCSTVLLCRRDVLQTNKFDECIPGNWHWEFIMRLLAEGRRVSTTAEIGAEICLTNEYAQAWSSEAERREIFDTLHRRMAAVGPGWRLPLTALGDGEITSIAWYHSGSSTAQSVTAQWGDRDSAEQLMKLREATSVRIALGLANRISRTAPWLQKPMRRLLRRRLNA